MAGEKRLIDANWMLGEIEHDLGCYELENVMSEDGLYVELRDVVRMVCAAPTVDAVEVVRCKECKSYDPGYIRQDHGWCKEWDTAVRAGGFCHHGERRIDGN